MKWGNVFYNQSIKENWKIMDSFWNRYFIYRVRQSTLRAGHSRFVPVIHIWYTIKIWKPVGHCDGQKTNPVSHTWNRAGQWPMTGRYFMHWYIEKNWPKKYNWKSTFFKKHQNDEVMTYIFCKRKSNFTNIDSLCMKKLRKNNKERVK